MAETTTALNACDVSVWLDNAAGTLKDISGSSNSMTLNFTKNNGSLQVFGTKWQIRLSCGKDATFTLIAVYSSATDEAADILKAYRVRYIYVGRLERLYYPAEGLAKFDDMAEAGVRLETATTS